MHISDFLFSTFKKITSLFFPKTCIYCESMLVEAEELLCVFCFHELPIITIKDSCNNEVKAVFDGLIPIKEVVSLLYYSKNGVVQKLIHQLKYKGNQKIGNFAGILLSNTINQYNFYKNIDCIIPVPLHSKKMKIRGYNQNTTFGLALSKALKVPYISDALKRVSYTQTQTAKNRIERFSNINSQFTLTEANFLKHKHILLIDDVITTGATIEACCKALLEVENITISVATIAYTPKI